MTETTVLDAAAEAMNRSEEDATLRTRFLERLAEAELYLLLEEEAQGDQVTPRSFELSSGAVVLAFDRPERLSRFAGGPAPYVAVSGRTLAQMLAGQGIGLGLNLDVAPSSTLLPPKAMTWLADTLATAPDEVDARISEVAPPHGLPERVLTALDSKLALMAGRAHSAYLANVTYEGGGRGHLLGFVDALPAAHPALAAAVSEALTFSGVEAGTLDVGFFAASDPVTAALAKSGLRFELPVAEVPKPLRPAPGSDPDKPPQLK